MLKVRHFIDIYFVDIDIMPIFALSTSPKRLLKHFRVECRTTKIIKIFESMIKKVKKIKVTPENLRKLAKAFGASESGIFNALAYRSNSERAIMIRRQAVENYDGVEVRETIVR